MKLLIRVKPLTINKAFCGRRFKTSAALRYDKEVTEAIQRDNKGVQAITSDWYEVKYQFFLKNYSMSDYDNLIKQTQDLLVKTGFIKDDRRIKKATIEKFKSKGTAQDPEGTVVEILAYEEPKGDK
jgi:Holliday junction resolvase RusA-like endonuclease